MDRAAYAAKRSPTVVCRAEGAQRGRSFACGDSSQVIRAAGRIGYPPRPGWHSCASVEHAQQAFGMTVPVTPSEMCHPSRAALLVYDAQVGILPAVREREAVTDRMKAVLGAVRAAGMPVLYTRHVSLPPS
jgi:hypothetical protein